MAPKVMTGARAKVSVIDPKTGQSRVVGIYSDVSYGVALDVQPAFILGRFSAAALEYTAAEPVNISATGYRVVHHGPHVDGFIPNLKDLLDHEYLTFTIQDRATGEYVGTIKMIRPAGYNTALNARQLSQMSLNYVGLLVDDEDTQMSESPDSTELP